MAAYGNWGGSDLASALMFDVAFVHVEDDLVSGLPRSTAVLPNSFLPEAGSFLRPVWAKKQIARSIGPASSAQRDGRGTVAVESVAGKGEWCSPWCPQAFGGSCNRKQED